MNSIVLTLTFDSQDAVQLKALLGPVDVTQLLHDALGEFVDRRSKPSATFPERVRPRLWKR